MQLQIIALLHDEIGLNLYRGNVLQKGSRELSFMKDINQYTNKSANKK
jgi:hypothetical protein